MADLPAITGEPILWQLRLDDPAMQHLAQGAVLRDAELQSFADRPQSAMRILRRRLTRLLLARLAGCHPDTIRMGRSAEGAPCILYPEGWFVSVAGYWPHGLIGIARTPLGVDIEPRNALPPPDDALTPDERAELAQASDHARLARWTLKEAHAKLWGIASQVDPVAIHTLIDGPVLRAISPQGSSICHLRWGPDSVCAVAQLDKDNGREPVNIVDF